MFYVNDVLIFFFFLDEKGKYVDLLILSRSISCKKFVILKDHYRTAIQILSHGNVVVDAHAGDEDDKAEELEHVEALPANSDGDHPDNECAHAVQHLPRCRRHLLRHGDPGKVKEGDRDSRVAEGRQQQRVVGELWRVHQLNMVILHFIQIRI